MASINLNDIDFANPIDISIPLRFDADQPNAFGVERTHAVACEYGDLVGDTRRGGSCNFERVTLIPHCNGTHTECIGHVTEERISITECLRDVLVPALLISVEGSAVSGSDETYAIDFAQADLLITRKALQEAIPDGFNGEGAGLVIRTLPNHDTKLSREYTDVIPPFFTTEAMHFIVKRGFKHLLVDLPSIDRLYDQGKLSNHRVFWNVEQRSFSTHADSRIYSTITELIYVPGVIEDGEYVLNLQIAPFASDAAPSRPLLFRSEPPA